MLLDSGNTVAKGGVGVWGKPWNPLRPHFYGPSRNTLWATCPRGSRSGRESMANWSCAEPPSVRVFVMHYKYNSVFKSVVGSVPMVCKPIWAGNK
ncbi:hypothetical protein NL676_035772 [Syzygium grande]|nr:hypothetical protein NL676_035772 [Syzygium grande]